MGFLKNGAIKTTTLKRATQLWNGLIKTLDANPNMLPREAFIKYMEEICFAESLVPIDPTNPSLSLRYVFSEFLNTVERDGELPWHQLFCLWTMRLVRDELSYDTTIGTEEDAKLIQKIVYNLLSKWTKIA